MCFSATASFAAGAVLIPGGGFALAQAWRSDRRYLTLASFPALFGVQQVVEGWVWLGIEGSTEVGARAAALGFLLFAYLLWLVLTPLAAYFVEERPARRRVFLAFAAFGAVFGLSLYAPVAALPEWLEVEVVRGSIVYHTRLVYDGLVSTTVLRVVYVGVICLPLLASSAPAVRGFGVLVALSVVVTFLFVTYAFTSVWCYLAAVVSGYVALLMYHLPRHAGRGDGGPLAASSQGPGGGP